MPAVEFQSAPWRKPNPGRVILTRPVWVHYGRVDLEKAHQFALDFGFTEVSRTTSPERIFYKGYNDQPVLYILEKTSRPIFFGGAMEAATEADLERASRLPGATPMRDSTFPGGGKIVTIRDPEGMPFHVVQGYLPSADTQPPKAADTYNPATLDHEAKPRRGRYQRIAKGPAPVFKLGHFGHVAEDVAKVGAWYMAHFNIRVADIQADTHDAAHDFGVFYTLDRGKHYVDHHVFFHFARLPFQQFVGHHHASFEVHDFDVQLQGHYHLERKGYTLMWGVGRHLMGSQVFDYWYDTEGFVVEHYTDGDVVNEDNPPERMAAEDREEYTLWGAEFNTAPVGFNGDARPDREVFPGK